MFQNISLISWMVYAMLSIGVLGFMVRAHHMTILSGWTLILELTSTAATMITAVSYRYKGILPARYYVDVGIFTFNISYIVYIRLHFSFYYRWLNRYCSHRIAVLLHA